MQGAKNAHRLQPGSTQIASFGQMKGQTLAFDRSLSTMLQIKLLP